MSYWGDFLLKECSPWIPESLRFLVVSSHAAEASIMRSPIFDVLHGPPEKELVSLCRLCGPAV